MIHSSVRGRQAYRYRYQIWRPTFHKVEEVFSSLHFKNTFLVQVAYTLWIATLLVVQQFLSWAPRRLVKYSIRTVMARLSLGYHLTEFRWEHDEHHALITLHVPYLQLVLDLCRLSSTVSTCTTTLEATPRFRGQLSHARVKHQLYASMLFCANPFHWWRTHLLLKWMSWCHACCRCPYWYV